MAKFASRWTAGLSSPEEKEKMENYLSGSTILLDKVVEICYNMIREAETQSNDYDSPNWALRQADLVGYRRALQTIAKLCSNSHKERPMTNG